MRTAGGTRSATVVAPARYGVIVSLATERVLTRGELIDILLAAGYRERPPGRVSSPHPLFRRSGPNRNRLIRRRPTGKVSRSGGSADPRGPYLPAGTPAGCTPSRVSSV